MIVGFVIIVLYHMSNMSGIPPSWSESKDENRSTYCYTLKHSAVTSCLFAYPQYSVPFQLSLRQLCQHNFRHNRHAKASSICDCLSNNRPSSHHKLK